MAMGTSSISAQMLLSNTFQSVSVFASSMAGSVEAFTVADWLIVTGASQAEGRSFSLLFTEFAGVPFVLPRGIFKVLLADVVAGCFKATVSSKSDPVITLWESPDILVDAAHVLFFTLDDVNTGVSGVERQVVLAWCANQPAPNLVDLRGSASSNSSATPLPVPPPASVPPTLFPNTTTVSPKKCAQIVYSVSFLCFFCCFFFCSVLYIF